MLNYPSAERERTWLERPRLICPPIGWPQQMERRKHPRFGLHFPVSFFGPRVNGTGLALNVSEEGCLIESDQCPLEGDYVEISLDLPDADEPLRIESAAVRWVTGRTFGLQFLFMSTAVLDRLHDFVSNLSASQIIPEPEPAEPSQAQLSPSEPAPSQPAPAQPVQAQPSTPPPHAPAPIDRRSEPRFAVRFRSTFSSGRMLGGEGTVTDLSSRGCRVSADSFVPAKSVLEMHLTLEEHEEPIKITEAVVRWSEGNDFGLEFREMDPKSFDRMRKVIQRLASA